jgi:hypothetical protein
MNWSLQVLDRAFRSRPVIASIALAVAAAGCTTVPTKEFASYKDAFAQARAAGEEVLLDYGAASNQHEAMVAESASPQIRQRVATFDASSASRPTAADAVAVRMQAWDVVARYNDLLTDLAEGKSANELAGAVDGLSSSLAAFPIASVALSATQVSGYLAPLKPLALEAVREKSRRDFVAAVGKGGDLINGTFLKLLRDDTKDFYAARKGLNDMAYEPLCNQIARIATRFDTLAKPLQDSPEIQQTRLALNAQLARLPPLSSSGKPRVPPVDASAGSAVPTPVQVLQLETLTTTATGLVDKALAKDAELEAYEKVLAAYVALLNQVETSMHGLQLAAAQAQPGIPSGDKLESAVIALREAYIAYKDK